MVVVVVYVICDVGLDALLSVEYIAFFVSIP